MIVEQRNSYGGTGEQRWRNSGIMMVEQWNSYGKEWKRDGGTVEQRWLTSGKIMLEQWNSDGGTVEQ